MSESAVSLLPALRSALIGRRNTTGLVAVSGGADSLALLHAAIQVAPALGIRIAAATFDHGLRGEASFDDAVFTAQTAGRWGVSCAVGRGRVDSDAAGVEERARDARYAFLAECASDIHADWVATAHHADDQAETVLMNVIRGAGTRGLGGMRAESTVPGHPSLPLLRPLLALRKRELESYCRANEIAFREDPTNSDPSYRRNWIRQTVVPLLESANPAVVASVARLALLAAEDDAFLTSWVDAWADTHAVRYGDRVWVRRAAIAQLDRAMQRRALLCLLQRLAPECEPSFEHTASVLDLLNQPEGGVVHVPGGMQVELDGEYAALYQTASAWSPPYDGYWLPAAFAAPLEAALDVPFGWRPFRADVDAGPDAPAFALEVGGGDVSLRTRHAGDRVALLGGGHQKLKDWLINVKAARMLRDHVPIIEVDGQIAAVWDGTSWEVFAFERTEARANRPSWVFVAPHSSIGP
ncbi:MAG: tRNA lysidine(34) synthetase TilS [Chloroflexi bacterium]|nr:tRNA lysidine(34) synthetase TilS [Chloroflexota bacterium]